MPEIVVKIFFGLFRKYSIFLEKEFCSVSLKKLLKTVCEDRKRRRLKFNSLADLINFLFTF